MGLWCRPVVAICLLALTLVPGSAEAKPHPWAWYAGSATFYGGANAAGTMGGACGFGNLYATGYGLHNAAGSPNIFKGGKGCGGCFQVRCVDSSWNSGYCYKGKTTIVTVTNLCPKTAVNPLCQGSTTWHLDMAEPMYSQIAQPVSGQIRTEWRRVKCRPRGKIHYQISGNPYYLEILISNVGGSGDLQQVWIQGNNNGWHQMQLNWGSIFSISGAMYGGQALSFKLQSLLTKQWLEVKHAVPSNWVFGRSYSKGQFNSNQGGGQASRRRRTIEIEQMLGITTAPVPTWNTTYDDIPLLDADAPDSGVWDDDEEMGSFEHPAEVQGGDEASLSLPDGKAVAEVAVVDGMLPEVASAVVPTEEDKVHTR